ncbi:MAG: hypothetical protein JW987_16095 [Anaerolineaceae bacterium]|nr:hypothetical protein [Anaerolineaceae bacterium]
MSVSLQYIDPGAETTGELYGLWQTQPGDIAGIGKDALSFDAGLPVRPDMPLGGVWRVDAAVSEAVEAQMAGQAQRLVNAGRSLDEAVLGEAQAATLASAAKAGSTVEVQRDQGLLTAFLEQAGRQVQYYAWVETTDRGIMLARSTVNWFGHLDTIWREDALAPQRALHQRSLELALATRLTTVKTALTVVKWVGLVARIATLSGPAALVVLPGLVWGAVNDVIYPILRSDLFQRS